MTFEIIPTDRLTLRLINQEVLDFVFSNYSDEQIIEFLGLTDEIQLEKEKTKWKKGWSTFNRTFAYFQLMQPSTNNIIGWCGYHTWAVDHDRAELGYGLFIEEEKRKGLMSEVMVHVLDFGFREMKLHRIEAMTSTRNTASIKVLEKFNFIQEGLLKEHYLIDGVYEDSLVFSLLNS